MLHDHRRDDGVERPVRDPRHVSADATRSGSKGTSPRRGRAAPPRDRPRIRASTRRDDPVTHERGEERPVAAAESASASGPALAWPRAARQPFEVEMDRRLGVPLAHGARGYAPPRRQSSVSPSHHPTLSGTAGTGTSRAATPCARRSARRSRPFAAGARRPRVNLRPRKGRLRFGAPGRRGREVRQRPAKPRTAVRGRPTTESLQMTTFRFATDLPGALAEWLGRGLQSPRTPVRLRQAPLIERLFETHRALDRGLGARPRRVQVDLGHLR